MDWMCKDTRFVSIHVNRSRLRPFVVQLFWLRRLNCGFDLMELTRRDVEYVEAVMLRQRQHPPVDGQTFAARILDLPLFIGDAQAAQDEVFLQGNNITHIVSLGTGCISPECCQVLTVDILDMEGELILTHFEDCITFLRSALADKNNTALVHCVYGQSRSATICVAYLMAQLNLTAAAAYDAVCVARPCIFINAGFLRQLQLFARMGNDANLSGLTSGHAQFRAILAVRERQRSGLVQLMDLQLSSSSGYSCSKCNFHLGALTNKIHGELDAASVRCSSIFLEPLQWMLAAKGETPQYAKTGKLNCPKCAAKLGSWSWIGIKCQCGKFVCPAFQLVPSRVRERR